MNTEEALAEVEKAGFMLLNLFQLSTGRWRSNVFKKDNATSYAFGEADTPAEAVMAGLAKAKERVGGAEIVYGVFD